MYPVILANVEIVTCRVLEIRAMLEASDTGGKDSGKWSD